MGQTLYFKFSGHPGSVQLFTELGLEPQRQIIIGTLELAACVLLLIPSSVTFGAILGSALMTGAFIGHFTVLGWEGESFSSGILAVVVYATCGLVNLGSSLDCALTRFRHTKPRRAR